MLARTTLWIDFRTKRTKLLALKYPVFVETPFAVRKLVEPTDKREIKPTESRNKPYSRPRLEVYGNLREITQTVGKAGTGDNPNVHHSHTQV